MYYVVEEYCVEAGCILMEIKRRVSDEDAVIMVSDSYETCKELVDGYHSYINEQIEEAELNNG